MAVVRGVATRFCNGGAASRLHYSIRSPTVACSGGFLVSMAAYVHNMHNIELIGYHTSP